MFNFYLNSLMSIGMTRKKAVSESQVIRDSDSSQKGVLDILQRSVKHFNN